MTTELNQADNKLAEEVEETTKQEAPETTEEGEGEVAEAIADKESIYG